MTAAPNRAELPALPEPKYIYHDNGVAGEDDLFVFAQSGPVDTNGNGGLCTDCERLYTLAQVEAIRDEALEWAAKLAESDEFYGNAVQHGIAAAIRSARKGREHA